MAHLPPTDSLMDLIRAFIETAFVHYPIQERSDNSRLLLKESVFVEVTKRKHLELSDDHIRLVFKLYLDKWSKGPAESNIFYSLCPFTREVICQEYQHPKVKLEHLFRWRELTQSVGEDLLTCACMAFCDMYTDGRKDFSWPSVLPTDDIDLHFHSLDGFADLHQHLKASTDVFSISWLCLMNKVRKRMGEFLSICKTQSEADKLYGDYIEAVAIRALLSKCIVHGCFNDIDVNYIARVRQDAIFGNLDSLEGRICMLGMYENVDYDYLFKYLQVDPKCNIYVSERWFLYTVIKRILEGEDNEQVSNLLWRYVVIKNSIRNKLVQNNENVGFGNFAEFESRKYNFINRFPSYANLLVELPVAEAAKHHQAIYQEIRITPVSTRRALVDNLYYTDKLIGKQIQLLEVQSNVKYKYIYHFIKKKDSGYDNFMVPRNYSVRCEVRKQAVAIKGMLEKYPRSKEKVVAIDAANSELFCRPEVFAQAYRYLENTGLRRTFHVGEDFYDLADGLRAIDEAITFLGLRRGDRMGHCLALGMNANVYYDDRHFTVPIPAQTLLDNIVWLYYKAKKYNIIVSPNIEMMIMDKFCELSKMYHPNGSWDMVDYYHMMKLRGDNPLGQEDISYGKILGNWSAYDLDMRKEPMLYRNENAAKRLYNQYHFNKDVREGGSRICEFKVNQEYVELVQLIQEEMMADVEGRGLAIECCPSSNFRIGGIGKYENHPIFRMHDVEPDGRHHLPVTINTDDLGIFTTSLDNEYSLIFLALLKQKNESGGDRYNTLYIRNWMEHVMRDGHKYAFAK